MIYPALLKIAEDRKNFNMHMCMTETGARMNQDTFEPKKINYERDEAIVNAMYDGGLFCRLCTCKKASG